MGYVRKTISIDEKQNIWVKKECINLSQLIRKRINKLMEA